MTVVMCVALLKRQHHVGKKVLCEWGDLLHSTSIKSLRVHTPGIVSATYIKEEIHPKKKKIGRERFS